MPKKKTEETPETRAEEKKTVKASKEDFEKKVVELAKKGLTAEKIGEALRKEGIHSKDHGKISRILKEKGLYQIPDVKNIEEKLARLTLHKEKNAQDKRAMRERERIVSLLRKQKKYHRIA